MFMANDIPGLQEAIRCFPNKPGEPSSGIYGHSEPFSSFHDMNSHDALASQSPRADSITTSLVNSPTPSSSEEPPPFPQPYLFAGLDSSTLPSPSSLNDVPAHNSIETLTPTRPSAARTPRSPLEARNTSTFKNHQTPYQSSPSSQGHPIPGIPDADTSGTFEIENHGPYQNQALIDTPITFAPPTFHHSFSKQIAKPASKSNVPKCNNKSSPAQVPDRVLKKSKMSKDGLQLKIGERHESGTFWRFTFLRSGPGPRREYVCDNPQSPDCRHSTNQSGDMARHQQGGTHLLPGSSKSTCRLCGEELKGAREDAMKRHQGSTKCKKKRAAFLSGMNAQYTTQVGEKRGWADMVGDDEIGEDEHPAKVSSLFIFSGLVVRYDINII
ncbi:hypothetical protein M413DRAFT_415997 [Hebeloma cylindrosporum]|uniref:Uncharacterized protein n=1 Tax=Hebeloma cylindrosporum TaxID=76867 RepID=A0A0C3BRN8_HEBCY|nr:hypothetical protein M413DRAFT_415997 [Hebeloma cylindrosporum h7]